jgi:deazaflavin-dependent oxidoreductase (nitroreductase family)
MSEVVRRELTRDPTIEITTIGTRSGAPRRIEIWMMVVDQRFFITGTPGPRDWLANLRANSELVVHLNTTPPLDVAARATEVTDEPTRRLVIGHVSANWYRNQSSVDELLAKAPMVEVVFDRGT